MTRPTAATRRTALRLLGGAVLASVAAAGLAACGRKVRPKHPEGADYPRTYPSTKKTTP